ncbi:sensor histidine kinase [Cellulomonas soli]|uniref:sensor histidine kinase n=1 Tax=Cellulomonas soli TaxID=931535 RepID=UPI003F8711BD
MTTSTAAQPAAPTSPGVLRDTLARSRYLLTSLPLALGSFTVLVTGLSLSAALVVLVAGIPLAAATLDVAGWFAAAERRRLEVIGHPVGRPAYRQARNQGLVGYVDRLRDPARWAEAAHGLVQMPVSVVTWSVACIWWSGAVVGLTSWIWTPLLPEGTHGEVGITGLDMVFPDVPRVVLDLAVGLIFAATLVPVMRGCTAAHTALGEALLSSDSALLRQQVEHLSHSRAQAAHAEAQSLRRLERDLHDGPQQRLIRLGMDLSTAERRLSADDVDEARVVIAEARRQTDEALAELRALSRGIAPPVLADRGLVAALVAAAATCTVPTALHTDVAEGVRLPPAVENAAYFVACEALANVAKHAGATRADVTLVVDGGVVRLTVADDGRGGAQVLPGHGLAGLQDRAAGVDGTVEITSGAGQGTMVTVRIPCA